MLTEEKINLNFVNFISKLKKYDCYTQSMENDFNFNEMLKSGSAFVRDDSGGAYEGSLVEHITRIAVIAFNLNNNLFEEVKAPIESLIRVCYLHQISRVYTIVKNDVDWEVKKGKLFRFANNTPALKTGEYSVFLCGKFGINLTEDEFEAILSIDKVEDDQTKYFSNVMSQILRNAIDLANTERRLRYKNYLKETKKEEA